MTASTVHVVAADHPAVDRHLAAFLDELATEERRTGRSVTRRLRPRGGIRVAALDDRRVVALARIDDRGGLTVAVAANRRGWGIGATVARTAIGQAIDRGWTRVVVHSERRSWAIRRVGERLGCTVVDLDEVRTDLLLPTRSRRRTA